MLESCSLPKLIYKETNRPHDPLSIGVLVDPSRIRRITLFLMVFKSPLNSPPSLNHVSFIPNSPSSSQILLNSCQDIGISIASDGKSRLFSWLSLSDPFMPMHNVLIYTYADDFT